MQFDLTNSLSRISLFRSAIAIIVFTPVLVLIKSYYKKKKIVKSTSDLGIFITGCDCGLGYSAALYCSKLGLTVFAGCLNVQGEGASKLEKLNNTYVLELDVKNLDSIMKCLTIINDYEVEHDVKLKYLVNNAGVMVFGEFHWLTDEIVLEQISVNLLGAMRVTKMFLSKLRKNQGRIINMSSHCALESLPGLSVYGASKAALLAWSNALRVELQQYNINVISFIPGSFIGETYILSNQSKYMKKMINDMPEEDLTFYKEHMTKYNFYLSHIPQPDEVKEIKNDVFYDNFKHSILSVYPNVLYCNSPKRYAMYHFLLKITPWSIHDLLLVNFTNMPRFEQK